MLIYRLTAAYLLSMTYQSVFPQSSQQLTRASLIQPTAYFHPPLLMENGSVQWKQVQYLDEV